MQGAPSVRTRRPPSCRRSRGSENVIAPARVGTLVVIPPPKKSPTVTLRVVEQTVPLDRKCLASPYVQPLVQTSVCEEIQARDLVQTSVCEEIQARDLVQTSVCKKSRE
jgi:hypothetical protein